MPRPNHKPSIENGELVRCSISQINTYDLCPRKWYYEKVAKFPRKEPSKGQETGDRCHKQIEHWFLHGEDVRDHLTRASDKYLQPYVARAPFNGGDIAVEGSLTEPSLKTRGGVEIIGYMDLFVPPKQEGAPEIIDHKFKKDLDRYGSTPEQLLTDTQGNVYAKWALTRHPEADRVIFKHIETQTQNRVWAREVKVELLRPHVEYNWYVAERKIDKEMSPLVAATDPKDVPYNEESCSAYGGCDFAGVCPSSPGAKYSLQLFHDVTVPEKKGTNEMGLLSRVTGSKPATPAVAAPAAAVAPPPAPAAPAVPTKELGPNGKVELQDHSGVAASEMKQGTKYKLPDGRVASLQLATPQGVFVVCDDGSAAALKPTDRVEPVVEKPAAPPPPATVLSPDSPASAPAAAVQPAVSRDEATAPVEQPAPAKRGPGRPRKNTAQAPATGAAPAQTATQANAEGEALVLCVNCFPNGPFTDLAAYVDDLAMRCAKAGGVADVRFASKDNPLAYGGWKGALAAAARENPPGGVCVIRSGDLADPVIEALAAVADMVIRA